MSNQQNNLGPQLPTMTRSQSQLLSSYAPGKLFAYEGGQGQCRTVPVRCQEFEADPLLMRQMEYRLKDAIESWVDAGMRCDQKADNPVRLRQVVDISLIRNKRPYREFGLQSIFFLMKPERMGYEVFPLTYVCNHPGCHYFLEFKDAREAFEYFEKTECCPVCREDALWRQINVVHVHPSGNVEPLSVRRHDWDSEKTRVTEWSGRCGCGSDKYRLIHRGRDLGSWHFQCTNPKCGALRPLYNNDPETLRIFGGDLKTQRLARFRAASANASSTHYTLSDQFVILGGPHVRNNRERMDELKQLIDREDTGALGGFIAQHYGFGGKSLSLDEVVATLRKEGFNEEARQVEDQHNMLEMLKSVVPDNEEGRRTIQTAQEGLNRALDKAYQASIALRESRFELPLAIKNNLTEAARQKFTSRFDPHLLAVEHHSLRKDVLEAAQHGGRHVFVPFDQLDHDLAPADEEEKEEHETQVRNLKQRLGLDEVGLIREFPLCRFSYGYTRRESRPCVEEKQVEMPVRLNLFPPLKDDDPRVDRHHPIYAIQQANEAFYFRLSPEAVYRWLTSFDKPLDDLFEWSPEDSVLFGGQLLQCAIPFGRFLDELKEEQTHQVYPMVYTLLHSYAHLVMKQIAEQSGLDLSSLGEYLFPTDLAFVVYRNGTTMDLGNLSSLWRNIGPDFLAGLLNDRTTQCSSGSLCDERGGACPDCIMIPETSCLAGNNLASRAVLRGGPNPYDHSRSRMPRIQGYFEVNRGLSK